MIKEIGDTCQIFKQKAGPPRRFKLKIGTKDLHFNHTVHIDTMFLEVKPVLHIVDQATHFCTATFLSSQNSDHIWISIANFWSDLYCGPPGYLRIDQDKNYTSQ